MTAPDAGFAVAYIPWIGNTVFLTYSTVAATSEAILSRTTQARTSGGFPPPPYCKCRKIPWLPYQNKLCHLAVGFCADEIEFGDKGLACGE
jgi:hypothetical protein